MERDSPQTRARLRGIFGWNGSSDPAGITILFGRLDCKLRAVWLQRPLKSLSGGAALRRRPDIKSHTNGFPCRNLVKLSSYRREFNFHQTLARLMGNSGRSGSSGPTGITILFGRLDGKLCAVAGCVKIVIGREGHV